MGVKNSLRERNFENGVDEIVLYVLYWTRSKENGAHRPKIKKFNILVWIEGLGG